MLEDFREAKGILLNCYHEPLVAEDVSVIIYLPEAGGKGLSGASRASDIP